MSEYQYLQVETLLDGRVVRILLDRPDARNAQNRGLLVELDRAMLAAEADDEVRVVILGGTGSLFSAGHDMGSPEALRDRTPGPDQHPSYRINGGTRVGAESRMLQEWHYFFQNTLRWRNLRKITIAQVNGKVYAAGLMLMWACDLIIAGEGTEFADVVGTRLGMCGIEYFAHPWEFGPRKTKELMLTGDSLSVDGGARARHGVQDLPGRRPPCPHLGVRGTHRRAADGDESAHQGVGQPDGRQHGLLQRAPGLLHAAPAEPLPLGRGPRRQDGAKSLPREDGKLDWETAPGVRAVKDQVRS